MAARLTHERVELAGTTIGGVLVLHELPERDASRNRLWCCRCACGRETRKSSFRLLQAERDGKRLRCAACARATHALHHSQQRRMRLEWHRECWRDTGSLYTYEWETQAENSIREEIAAELGFWPGVVL